MARRGVYLEDAARRIKRHVDNAEHTFDSPSLRPSNAITPVQNLQWVKITSTTQTDGKYPGQVETQNSDNTFTALGSAGDIWVRAANGGTLATGEHYLARASSVYSDGKAIFTVDDGLTGKANVIHFTLVATLTETDSFQAGATVDRYYQGTNPGATVTIWNPPASVNFMFSGATGHKGMALYNEAADKYWIVQLECAS